MMQHAGQLRVEIWYGHGGHHVVTGDMSLYPRGVTDILHATQIALERSTRIGQNVDVALGRMDVSTPSERSGDAV